MSHEWVSARAVAWVIHDAPVPADLAWTLTVIAARCDEHGRGSFQSAATIAEKTGKSPSQVERDLTRLRELGLLLLGDQRLTERMGGQRPVVYDVPLNVKGPKPVKKSKNPTGKKGPTSRMDAGRGETSRIHAGGESSISVSTCENGPSTSRIHAGGGMDATPRMDAGATSRMDAAAPPASMRDKEPLNNPLNNPSLGPARDKIAQVTDATPEEMEEMIILITQEWNVRTPDKYVPSMKPGDLGLYLARVRARHVTTPVPPPAAEVLAAQAAHVPQPRGDQPPPDPGEAIADVRARLLALSPAAARRPDPAPTAAARPDEPDPAAQAAHAYLAGRGDAFDHLAAAREKLGPDAARDEVVILAAELAGMAPAPAGEEREASYDRNPETRDWPTTLPVR